MIFVDVGAHEGQTLAEVTKPRWPFDLIVAYEPMPREYAILTERFGDDRRVILANAGLGDATERRTMYGTNDDLEASIYACKRDVDSRHRTECAFVEASTVVEELAALTDGVVMKLNCEGSEVPILANLCDTGSIHHLAAVMIDFDIGKVVGERWTEHRMRRRLYDVGFDRYLTPDAIATQAPHAAFIAAWLERLGL